MAIPHDPRTQRVDRRTFLRALTLVVGGIPLLAACGQPPSAQRPPEPTPAAAKPTEVRPAAAPTSPPAAAAPTSAPAPAASPTQAAPAKAGGPLTIKFMNWWWAEAGRNDAMRAMVKKFHDAQNDIRIEEVGFAFSDYASRVMTQLAGGRLDADVIIVDDALIIRMIRSGYLEPIDDIVAKLGIKNTLIKTHEFVTVGGKQYGIVVAQVPYAIIYNKELYDKAGITKPPATQEEYFTVAKQLTRRPEQFGHAGRNTMAEASGFWFDLTHWVLGYGGVWAKAKKPLVTETPVLNAVKAYKRLYDEAMPQGATASTYRRMAGEGKIGQYIDNSANIGNIRAVDPNILPKIFTAPPPWENRRSGTPPAFGAVYAGSKNKDAGKLWWEFFFKKENFQQWAELALDIIGPYDGAVRPEYLKGLHWSTGYLGAQGMVFAQAIEGFEANAAEFQQTTLRKVSEVLTAGKAPEQAMKEAQQELEALAGRIP
ncbi:MAG: extracellular solute-binding protein [Chloroflexi bacterium]|nr:extracellular solute-binding protein [Chloroflexota bacterium]